MRRKPTFHVCGAWWCVRVHVWGVCVACVRVHVCAAHMYVACGMSPVHVCLVCAVDVCAWLVRAGCVHVCVQKVCVLYVCVYVCGV